MPEDSDEDEGGEGGDDDDDEDAEMDDGLQPVAGPSKSKKSKTGKKGKVSPPWSEVSDSESEEEGWGKKKSEYYASNAGQFDSEDEEANELEEQEAKRLQAKAREALTEDDFGLGDAVEKTTDSPDEYVLHASFIFVICSTNCIPSILEEPVAPTIQTLPQDKPSLLRHMEKTNPEALALARDWEDVAYTLTETQAKIEAYVCCRFSLLARSLPIP